MPDLTVTIPASCWFTSNRMPTNRGHHARMKGELRTLTKGAYRTAGRPAWTGPVHLCWWIGYPPRARNVDSANAQPVTKAILDQLVREGLLPEDHDKHVVSEMFRRETRAAPPGMHTVRLTVTDQGVPF